MRYSSAGCRGHAIGASAPGPTRWPTARPAGPCHRHPSDHQHRELTRPKLRRLARRQRPPQATVTDPPSGITDHDLAAAVRAIPGILSCRKSFGHADKCGYWARRHGAVRPVPGRKAGVHAGPGSSVAVVGDCYGEHRAGVAADAFVAAFERELAREKTADHPVAVWVNDHGEHARVTLLADWGNIWLGPVVARAAGDVQRALVGLDHDEYGVEHVVFDGRGGPLLRVHHVYVYPHGEPDEQYAPTLAGLPARADLTANPDGTLTGVDALAAAAALYHVAADRMGRAVQETANAFESLQIVFTPLAPWWNALGVTYPVPDLGEPTVTLPRAGA